MRDSGNLAILALLDLSVAFDSVDNDTLHRLLQTYFGLGDPSVAGLLFRRWKASQKATQ